MTTHLSKLAQAYFGGLVHAHTRLSNHRNHHESDLSVDHLVDTLVGAALAGRPGAPLQYVMFNEHPSDPGRPRRLGRLSLRGRRLLRQRRRPLVHRVPLLYGLEVSLLAGGRTDLTPRLADHCALVIASRHALPAKLEHDAAAITELFWQACSNPHVEVLGHPPRYIENLPEIAWPHIFDWAAATGTAIEVNLNAFPAADSSPLQHDFWKTWLQQLARSTANVIIGTDIHNQYQLEQFILQWQSLEQPHDPHGNHLAELLLALEEAKLPPERVVSASFDRFSAWLQMDKAARASLPLNSN